MQLSEFNNLPEADAVQTISQCCAAQTWVQALVSKRPYQNLQSLLATADACWRGMHEADLLEAFSAHPQIGNVDTLRAKYANTKALAAGEQSLVQGADDTVLHALADLNQAYLDKFGFIFIVCATGKSAAEMLHILERRLANERHQELQNAADEQHKITTLRLTKLLAD